MTDAAQPSTKPMSKTRRVAGQGALLFAGFGAAQALSFVRNALIGHALAKGDFGIAATITLVLQSVDTVTDLGADRLLVQAGDGAEPRFVRAAHTLLAARGALLAVVLFFVGPHVAHLFGAAHAADAFQLIALVPLIKGFTHLDFRLAQRRLDNRPQMVLEVAPQAVALLLTLPLLSVARDYTAVVSLTIAQALAGMLLSHALAKSPYGFAADARLLKRQFAFGWPILVSALPLVAVYQGDRAIIASLGGMEALANYAAAGMITMVPGLIAAKVGHAILLPLFAGAVHARRSLNVDFKAATEATVVLAAVYLVGFIIAGETLLTAVFGAQYAGLSAVTGTLAAMWSVRMIQAVPGMALMAHGATKPFIVAGSLRALALPFVLVAAWQQAGLTVIAAIGCGFEVVSLAYVAWRLQRLESGLGRLLAQRAAFVLPAALFALLAAVAAPTGTWATLSLAVGAMLVTAASGIATMPSLMLAVRRMLGARALVAAT